MVRYNVYLKAEQLDYLELMAESGSVSEVIRSAVDKLIEDWKLDNPPTTSPSALKNKRKE